MPGIFLEPDDLCVYVTEACNSNCVMCPMSLASRRRGLTMAPEQWAALKEIDPQAVFHITITGGEPFLDARNTLAALALIRERFPEAEVLILTNGRALAVPEIASALLPLLTERVCLAIPIHAPEAELHDRITQTPHSFAQAIRGIRALAASAARIEARVVAHRWNLEQLSPTFRMLTDLQTRITVINLIAMEMTGCAAARRGELWVDYREAVREAREGILYTVRHGIDVGLYNFPLCSVPRELWPIVKNSISPRKIRYDDACENCAEREACGGMFYSTRELGLFRVEPIEARR